jgi:hypothetical protein
MSVKTRIEALEKQLAKPEREETVIHVGVIVVQNCEEVAQLRELRLMDSRQDSNRPIPCGPVRLVVETVEAKDLLTRREPHNETSVAILADGALE